MDYGIFRWLPTYDWTQDFPGDVIAGITVGMMAIPQSISYAAIAGLPAEYGLYSDIQIMYPLLGTSKYLVVGPVAVMSLMSRLALEGLGKEELTDEWISLACLLSFLVFVIQLSFAVSRLGSKLYHIFSEIIVTAFASAAALIIASTQLTGLVGLPKCSGCSLHATLLHVLFNIHLAEPQAILCSLCSIAILSYFKRCIPSHRLASNFGPITVVCLNILMVSLVEGEGALRLKLVGSIPSGVPEPRGFPRLPAEPYILLRLIASAVPISLIGYIEATTIAKASAKLNGQDVNSINVNEEMFALAGCNAFTSWIGGYPVTGSFSRTAINAESGAKSPLSTAVAAVTVVAVLIHLTSFLSLLPIPAISSIVLSCVVKLVDYKEFLRLRSTWMKDKSDQRFVLFCVVFFLCIFWTVEGGLFVGVIVNQVAKRFQASRVSAFEVAP